MQNRQNNDPTYNNLQNYASIREQYQNEIQKINSMKEQGKNVNSQIKGNMEDSLNIENSSLLRDIGQRFMNNDFSDLRESLQSQNNYVDYQNFVFMDIIVQYLNFAGYILSKTKFILIDRMTATFNKQLEIQ